MRWMWVLVAVACAVGLLVLGSGGECYDAPSASGSYCTAGMLFGHQATRVMAAALVFGLVGALWQAVRRPR